MLVDNADHSATAPTVMAFSAAPGEPIDDWSAPELPAATTTILPPSLAAELTAWLNASWPSEGSRVPKLIEMI